MPPEDEFELIRVGRNGGAGRKLTILQFAATESSEITDIKLIYAI